MIHTLLKASRLAQRRTPLIVLTLVMVNALSSSPALGHAKLLRSVPQANVDLKQPPKTIELWFSEELEQSASTIIVTDQNGKNVDKNNVSVGEGDKKLQIDLEELGTGTYKVEWKALSTDGHVMKGEFTFNVTLDADSAALTSPAQQNQGTKQSSESTLSPAQRQTAMSSDSMQMSGTSWTQSFVRWLQYLAMMMLFGGFGFHTLVLAPALRRSGSLSEMGRAAAMSLSARRVILFSWLSLTLLVMVTLIALILQASMVFDKSFVEALSPGLLNQVITTTGFGASWRLQVWAIGVLIIVVFYLSRRLKHAPSAEYRMWWWACFVAGAVLLLAPAWTGHAVVAAKQFPFAVGTDWLHLLGAGFWVGGLFHLALTMPKAISVLDEHGRLRVLHRVISLFTRLAIVSTVVITLTGIYNSWMHVDRFGALWSTPYGETLLVKVLLVVPILALGGINTFVLHPRASRLLEKKDSASDAQSVTLRRSFYRSVGVEAALGGLVLLVAAILVFLQPAREHPVSNNSRSDSITVVHNLADQ